MTLKNNLEKYKPGVTKPVLLFLAGTMWLAVGAMLLILAYSWLKASSVHGSWIFGGIGVLIALIVHHFGFLKIVDKNLDRILPMQGKQCVFAFITWKSYLIIVVMIALGIGLRHSPIPKPYLAIVYIGIGLALLLSSIRYLRVLLTQLKNKNPPGSL
jgi:hypothetical protein